MALCIVELIGLHWSHTTRQSSSRCMPVRIIVRARDHLLQRIIVHRTLGSLESIMMLQRGLYPYPPNELWGRNSWSYIVVRYSFHCHFFRRNSWAGNHLFDLVALYFQNATMLPFCHLCPVFLTIHRRLVSSPPEVR